MTVAKEIDGRVYVQDEPHGHRWCEVLGEPGVNLLRRGEWIAKAIRDAQGWRPLDETKSIQFMRERT